MTKTQAIREAKAEITMFKQGRQWVVSSYDEQIRCNRLHNPQSFAAARETVTAFRAETALLKMGYADPDIPGVLSVSVPEHGSLEDRIDRAVGNAA